MIYIAQMMLDRVQELSRDIVSPCEQSQSAICSCERRSTTAIRFPSALVVATDNGMRPAGRDGARFDSRL